MVELVEHLLADLRRHGAERRDLARDPLDLVFLRCLNTWPTCSSPSAAATIAALRAPVMLGHG